MGAPEATGTDNNELGLDLIRISFELAVPYQMSFNAGNIWFDTFVAPWLANQIPAALEVPRNGSLVIGAVFSYVPMAVGWTLFGVACLQARVIPLPLALCLIPAGILAFFPLPPYSIGFGAVVWAPGIWVTRHCQVSPRDGDPLDHPSG